MKMKKQKIKKILLFLILFTFFGCDKNNGLSQPYSISETINGIRVLEFNLKDGTRCITIGRGLSCNWRNKK